MDRVLMLLYPFNLILNSGSIGRDIHEVARARRIVAVRPVVSPVGLVSVVVKRVGPEACHAPPILPLWLPDLQPDPPADHKSQRDKVPDAMRAHHDTLAGLGNAL